MKPGVFLNSMGECFTLAQMLAEMDAFAAGERNREYAVIIGTDSQVHARETTFVTAVIIHRIGESARFFYRRTESQAKLDLAGRILHETSESIALLEHLVDSAVIRRLGREVIEVHIDAGSRGKSQRVMDACINYVKGMGYNYRVKPEAYGATHVADRYTK
ncbi:MAG: hypothetical protein J0L75_20275 [Spirochaetes bacterium]|nr:hypothetical protein [Spirochaetota bacterium]